VIISQLSEIDGYDFGWSTAKQSYEEGNEPCVEKISDNDQEQEEGKGDNGLEEEEDSETEKERDTRLHNEVRANGRLLCTHT